MDDEQLRPRHSFTRDPEEAHNLVGDSENESAKNEVKITQLSYAEKKSVFLVASLSFIHAVPLCFTWATLPIVLRQVLSYSDVGTALVAQYPYSIKILWSPIIASVYNVWLGRRKSWIVPSFALGALVLFWLGLNQDDLILQIAAGHYVDMAKLVMAWLIITFLCSCVRIALDAWGLDLLSSPNVHWSSTAVAMGEGAGCFMAFNVFLGLSPPEQKPTSARIFLSMAGAAFALTAIALFLGNKEEDHTHVHKPKMGTSYAIIWKIIKLPQVRVLMLVHMTSMIGFMTNDSITVLELVKNGLTDRHIAAIATVSFPLEVTAGIMISRILSNKHPLELWRAFFPLRLATAVIAQIFVLIISSLQESRYQWMIAVLPYCLSKLMDVSMYVSLVAFHAQISDPQHGAIYIPLLATTLNIRYDTMGFLFTKLIGLIDGAQDLTKPTPMLDGYQIVNISSVLVAIPVFWFFLRPATVYLQSMKPSAWRVVGVAKDDAYELVANRDDEHRDRD